MPLQTKQWRFSSRVLLPIVAAGSAAALLVITALFLAARQSDDIAWERQRQLVSHVLSEQIAKISHDQQSVTIWDDAVKNTKLQFDASWVSVNLGVWMHDYFGHDEIFILNRINQPIYANMQGSDSDVSTYQENHETIAALVLELRQLLVQAKEGDAASDPDKYHASDLVVIENRPAIVSVLPIVSDSGKLSQLPGTEFLHVSVRFLDRDFLGGMSRSYFLEAPRFAWTQATKPGESAFPLLTDSGKTPGYFIWQPDRPGWRILLRTAPALGTALLVVAAIVALLTRRLRGASTELEASEAQAQHLAFHDALTGLP